MARGSIIEREHKNGEVSYDVVVSYKDDTTSKWRQIWKTAPSKRQAETLRTKLLGEVDKDSYVKPSKLTTEAFLKEWLTGLPSTVSPRTCQLYEYICRIHLIPAFGSMPLSQLRSQRIQALYASKLEQGLSPRTVQLFHVCLHKSLSNAVKTGILVHNPCDAVDQPKVERHEIKIMAEDDIIRFLNEAKKVEYYALFHTYLYTGTRRSELLAVRWSDVDLSGMTMSINRSMRFMNNKITFNTPKTASSRRQIALSPSTCAALRFHREKQDKLRQSLNYPVSSDNDLVFCQYDGKPLLPDSVTHAWIKLTRRCGLDGVRLHDARHTHASLLLKQGVHPKVVQERLGHASIAITLDTYSHTVQGMQKAAAAGFDDAITGKVSPSNSLDSH